MGNIQSLKTHQHQKASILSYKTEHDLRVLEWRSNPALNEFIPKVFFQYQQNKNQKAFLSQCKTNENLPVDIKFQKFIGDLKLLNGKLRFQESLYVLKCLLIGFQVILKFFGKAIVDSKFCFVTKDGEVKAWINNDYRKNSFFSQIDNTVKAVTSKDNLFLQPQNWIDRYQTTSSPTNIIQKILVLVSELTFEEKEYQKFVQKVDAFITENILKNYNFDRIARFTNKYIYQKKIFVKSNLLEAIARIYEQDHNQNRFSNRSQTTKNSQIIREPSQISMITSNSQYDMGKPDESYLRKHTSGHESSERNFDNKRVDSIKKSTFFSSTAHSNSNSRFNSASHSNNYRNWNGHIYGNQVQSHCPLSPKFQANSNQNHICPQFSFNCVSVTNKLSNSQNKIGSFHSNPKSSFISSQSSMNNNNFDYKVDQNNLKIITQRKQTQPEQQNQIKLKKSIQFLSPSIHVMSRKNSEMVSSPYESRKSPVKFSNFNEENKKSSISIGFNMQNNFSLKPNEKIKLFKSNCFDNESMNRKKECHFTGVNKINEMNGKSINQKSQANMNLFTMKTITKLISSNENISDQHQSEGDFPSNENISSYSGILASMGRSVQILQVPDVEKLDFRSKKKLKTMFFTNPNSHDKTTFMSADMFQTQ